MCCGEPPWPATFGRYRRSTRASACDITGVDVAMREPGVVCYGTEPAGTIHFAGWAVMAAIVSKSRS